MVGNGGIHDANTNIKLPLSKEVLSFAHTPVNTSGGFPTSLSNMLPSFPPPGLAWGSTPLGGPLPPGNPSPPPSGRPDKYSAPGNGNPGGLLPKGGSSWSGPNAL